ncbi:MAG: ATP-binding protein, partial [Anaerolineae bacterium]|nr:ATP-binding protein [Anaerolineae bacterium]
NLEVEDSDLHMHISDRGIGIPESDHDRLFDAFFRAGNVGDVPGSGLGLMIVKQAIELHGGSISFTSRQNVGTTFHLMLPLTGLMNGARAKAATSELVPQMIY